MDKIPDVSNWGWWHWVDRPYGPFILSLIYPGVNARYFSKAGLPGFGYSATLYQYPILYQSRKLSEPNNRQVEHYLQAHSLADISKLITKLHANNKKELKKTMQSKKPVLEKLSNAKELVRLYLPFLWIVDPLDWYFERKIEELVPKYVPGDYRQWLGDASIPKKKNEYVKMLEALQKKPVQQVLKKFFWLKPRDGFSAFYTLEELQEIKSYFQKPAVHAVFIPVPLKNLVRELREFTFFRTDRTDKFYEFLGLMRPLFFEVADELGLSFEDLALCSAESVLNGKPKRIGVPFNYLCLHEKHYFSSKPIVEFAKENTQKVAGQTAFAGIVKGTVKVVKHPSDLEKVRSGDVLVAQMTFPSFIAAMQRARAFVTDEGGITCHAAIVAREMKKPCIIATKNATKVFKDGDYVEVNATAGVVRILKKS